MKNVIGTYVVLHFPSMIYIERDLSQGYKLFVLSMYRALDTDEDISSNISNAYIYNFLIIRLMRHFTIAIRIEIAICDRLHMKYNPSDAQLSAHIAHTLRKKLQKRYIKRNVRSNRLR